jgi:MFS family permease
VGLIWCVGFALRFRNRPSECPWSNDAERALIREGTAGATEAAHSSVPWGKILLNPAVVLLSIEYCAISFSWYFNLNYLPEIMRVQFGVPKGDVVGALFKGGPLILGAVGCLVGGWLTDRLIRRGAGIRMGRSLPGMVGTGFAALCCLLATYPLMGNSAMLFALAVGFSGFFNDLTLASSWAICQDIGRRQAAIVAGTMNMIGNLGGFLGTVFTGWLIGGYQLDYASQNHIPISESHSIQWVQKARETLAGEGVKEATKEVVDQKALGLERAASQEGFRINLMVNALVYVIAFLCWLGIDGSKPILLEDEHPPTD